VRTCSSQPQIESGHLTLRVPWRLSSLKRADTVIVPGIDNLDRPIPQELLRPLRAAVSRRARVATGAFILARTSALYGLKATTHWLAAQELARRQPTVDVDPDVLYVDNGNVLTSAGAAAVFDLCRHLVRRDLGAEIAASAARAVVVRRRGHFTGFDTGLQAVDDGLVNLCVDLFNPFAELAAKAVQGPKQRSSERPGQLDAFGECAASLILRQSI
jgi:transcriptional regulator GlxA family with amidase domain